MDTAYHELNAMNGKTLGHYRVGEQLGRGGMGEVYVADDVNLNRKVALKFLPDAFAGDPERMARFEREARLLASLNHSNIAAIYGLEQAEGKRFIVMELVEGETLAQRIGKGALPVEDALAICRQIAEGLEAAHEKGVIHRDLKPANVMIAEGDKVKILDFGLAKALSDEVRSIDSSQSPTLTEAMTRPGVILGTAAYMSPEQAKGKSVDKRADIWAFGCILYECFTGKRAFEGETVTETLAAVLTKEPDWEKVPAKIEPLLRRCVEKDPKKRLRHIGDIDVLLESNPEPVSAKRPWIAWSVASLAVLIAGILTFMHFSGKPPDKAEPMRFEIALPHELKFAQESSFALSPDGRSLVFGASGSDGVRRLWIRPLNSLEAHSISGTEFDGINFVFWSHDSRFVVFDAGAKLMKIPSSGGLAQTICDLPKHSMGGSWNRDNVIIFGTFVGDLMRVYAEGGAPVQLTRVNRARQEMGHYFPNFLADGRHFLYWCASNIPENQGIYVGSLDASPEEQGSRQLVAGNAGLAHVPAKNSTSAYLIFLREEALIAQPFDEKRLELLGNPQTLAEGVGSRQTYGLFSASKGNVLAYMSGGRGLLTKPTWYDRQGKALSTVGDPGIYYKLAISPDGGGAAVGNAFYTGGSDIWLFDFRRGINRKFTLGNGNSSRPVWSPDGKRIIFNNDRESVHNLYQKEVSGAKEEELLLKSGETKIPTSWSSDGRYLLYTVLDPKTKGDLWVLPMEKGAKPMPLLRREFNEGDGHFSPDMRWIAYVSDESGRNEVYVRDFTPVSREASLEAGAVWVVSKGGGRGPRWRGDGKELYYYAADDTVMAVSVATDTTFHAAIPAPLFKGYVDITAGGFPLSTYPVWDVASDGKRFFMPAPVAESLPSAFTVILNWTSLLKK